MGILMANDTTFSDPRETLDNSRQPQASVPDILPKILESFDLS